MKKIILLLAVVGLFFSSCDKIDEWLTGAEPLPSNISFVVIPECGSQLTTMYQAIYCRQVPIERPVYRYRFIVRNAATGVEVGTVDKTVNNFNFVEIGIENLTLATAYKVEVQVALTETSGFTNVINPNCVFITPNLPDKSKVISPACGSETSSFWRMVYAYQSLGAEKYRFVIDDGTSSQTIETLESSFQLADLPNGPAANTEYRIRVDVLYQGVWYQGDEVCSIFTSPGASFRQAFDGNLKGR